MFANFARRLVACSALAACSLSTFAAEILIADAKSQPESMSVGPGGTLYVGSASSPFVYRVQPGATTAEKFIDVSSEPAGTFFLGVLADGATNTLWTCQLTPIAAAERRAGRHTALRGWDLKTGAAKLRWDLPGDNTTCNDMVVGPDKALYLSDTGPGRIYRLAPGAQSADLFSDHRLLSGIDGITFLDGTLYINSVVFNKLYRIPVTNGKAGQPEDIWMDQPVKGPDGMRAANGKLFLAENGSGIVSALTITGARAHVTVLKDGLKTPTGVEPAGDTLWFTERGTGKVMSISMPK